MCAAAALKWIRENWDDSAASRQKHAALPIQKAWRGFGARNRTMETRLARRGEAQEWAALMIQKHCRASVVRQLTKELRYQIAQAEHSGQVGPTSTPPHNATQHNTTATTATTVNTANNSPKTADVVRLVAVFGLPAAAVDCWGL